MRCEPVGRRAPRFSRSVAEAVARREGSLFSVAVLSRYDETKEAVQRAVGAADRDAVLLRQSGRPFYGMLVDPPFELWIINGRSWLGQPD